MKQTLLHLLGLSPECKAQSLEKQRKKNIKDRNARMAVFDKRSLEHRKKCEDLVKAGYTKMALPTQACTLVFGTHSSPVFSSETAAALFAKFLKEDNICTDDITLEEKICADFFEGVPGLCWMYKDFYITFNMKPEYGYMNSETCKNLSSYINDNDIVSLQVNYDFNKFQGLRYLNLDFERKQNQLKAKQLCILHNKDKYKSILRTYPDNVSEAELVNDCKKYRYYFSND